MSLVGPRPLLFRYLPYFTEDEIRRHDVRPGITGLAQVSGRNFLNWDDRLALDLQYVDNCSLAMDFMILCRTVSVVLRRRDVAEDTSVTMKDLDDERKGLSRHPASDG
jgi:lipopolysaccharide/colanic/teichoic acid biosynthesis glycosyltransferase